MRMYVAYVYACTGDAQMRAVAFRLPTLSPAFTPLQTHV